MEPMQHPRQLIGRPIACPSRNTGLMQNEGGFEGWGIRSYMLDMKSRVRWRVVFDPYMANLHRHDRWALVTKR